LPRYEKDSQAITSNLIEPLHDAVNSCEQMNKLGVSLGEIRNIFTEAQAPKAKGSSFVFDDDVARRFLYSSSVPQGSSIWKGTQDYRSFLQGSFLTFDSEEETTLTATDRDFLYFRQGMTCSSELCTSVK